MTISCKLKEYHDDVGFSVANFILLIKSSTDMVPSSPPNLDLTVTVSVSTSFEPTTAINGIFCFSAFLMSLGRRSPWQTSARMPFIFSFLVTSLLYSSCVKIQKIFPFNSLPLPIVCSHKFRKLGTPLIPLSI